VTFLPYTRKRIRENFHVYVIFYITYVYYLRYVKVEITSRRRREMYCGQARPSVCVSVRGRMPTLLHGPECKLGGLVGDAL